MSDCQLDWQEQWRYWDAKAAVFKDAEWFDAFAKADDATRKQWTGRSKKCGTEETVTIKDFPSIVYTSTPAMIKRELNFRVRFKSGVCQPYLNPQGAESCTTSEWYYQLQQVLVVNDATASEANSHMKEVADVELRR